MINTSGQVAMVHVGEAADGRVRVVVSGGRVASCRVDPRALALTPEELAGHALEAVNAALDDEHTEQSGQPPVIDPLALAGQFREIRDDVAARAEDITAAIQESAWRLRQEAEVSLVVPRLDLGPAFDRLAGVLEAIGQAAGDAAEVSGEGVAAGGLVRVVCRPAPRLDSVTIRPRAMRNAAELGDGLMTAVNLALDDLAARTRECQQAAGADPEQIAARIADLRESGVAEMRAYGQALSDLMDSIGPLDSTGD
ncbi:YbaB/EbfC family nucleoid-associated protein [Nonomuraea sp. NPDC000554]|uniref:YbaB/EbfC family nucleoid-associated protein n=1 Tax=Nonomuraea sp. NPDC000554 TaxID=3154259 RepID=UPI00332A66DA